MEEKTKDSKPMVRVALRSDDLEPILKFLSSHEVDLTARPHRVGKKWRVEFFIPLEDAKALDTGGCETFVDEGFFERLRAAHAEAEARKPSKEQLEKLFASGRFPGVQIDRKGNVREVR
jgi:hypothetical protein